jgi:anti-sigma regulatory factor (Ser/Thr protein kinase)
LTTRNGFSEVHLWRVQMPARQTALNRLLDRFDALSRTLRLPMSLRRDLHLVLDEVVSNVVHANTKARATRVGLELSLDRGAVTLEVIDNGKSFDPTLVKPPRGSILDRPPGGLGIHLVQGMMDKIVYTRQHGTNHLVMTRSASKNRAAR